MVAASRTSYCPSRGCLNVTVLVVYFKSVTVAHHKRCSCPAQKRWWEPSGHRNEAVWAGPSWELGKRQLKLRCRTRLIWTEGSGLRCLEICKSGNLHDLVICLKTFTVGSVEPRPGQGPLDHRCPRVNFILLASCAPNLLPR
jgi:hypothetical protein